MGFFNLFKKHKQQNFEPKDTFVKVEQSENSRKLLVSAAENEEKNGDYLKALGHYTMAKDKEGSKRVKKKLKAIKKESLKRRDEELKKLEEIKKESLKRRNEELKKRIKFAIPYKDSDFLKYAETLTNSTWDNDAGLNEIRLEDYRRAISIFIDRGNLYLVKELWIKQAEKDANNDRFGLAREDHKKALELTKNKKEQDELNNLIDKMEAKTNLKKDLDKAFRK
jgi:anthranilate/para-aminobenzoate synthase component I